MKFKQEKNFLRNSSNNDNVSTQVNKFLFQSKEKTFKSVRSTQVKKSHKLLANKNKTSNSPQMLALT